MIYVAEYKIEKSHYGVCEFFTRSSTVEKRQAIITAVDKEEAWKIAKTVFIDYDCPPSKHAACTPESFDENCLFVEEAETWHKNNPGMLIHSKTIKARC
jgi:hypothetical protein